MVKNLLSKRWYNEGGYKELLILALPLIISTGSWSLQHFIDRMFLTWHSSVSIAASVPAGILNFTVVSLFMGTASYVSTFVAQYYGANNNKMIGPSLWQGLYVSVIAGITLLAIMPFSSSIFEFIGHEPKIIEEETIYFSVLCLGAFPLIASSAMSGFFSGLGKTKVVMWTNVSFTIINLLFDYLLIFGKLGFPEMGIRGAAYATVLSAFFSFIVYSIIIFNSTYDKKYNTRKEWKLQWDLFSRLIKYGLPSGIQFFLEIAGITVFLLLIGKLGKDNLAATNIAFNINTLAFMPMIGFGIAVSVMVGQNLGKDRSDLAEYSVYSGLHLTMGYMTIIAILFILIPEIFIAPFAARANPQEFEAIRELVKTLLRFVAVYCVFDALNIIFASAIKGAGDTRFVMFMIAVLSITGLIIPSYLILFVFELGLYAGWTLATAYIVLLGFAFMARFLTGKWKSMRVIDISHSTVPPMRPECPGSELDI